MRVDKPTAVSDYRADIDGLRAVAVLSVLFYHAGLTLFSGGYVGVDIFFVISGYLITRIIVREIANNEFSLARFYERRFRRILPALAAVILACFIAGAWLLSPNKLTKFSESAIATTVFSSNILFYFETNYFDAVQMKPLLHTWSLAIEEQYYIFFPLLLLLISKKAPGQYFKWLLALTVVSFVGCVLLTPIDASAAFYLLPTRAWELLLGGLLILPALPAAKSTMQREAIAAVGLVLILYSVFCFTPETSFPGYAVAAPTLGAALIIYAGMQGLTQVSRLLAWRPMVFVGLISYSLYLWHWPVFVYSKIYLIKTPGATAIAVMLIASFVLAILSWRFVETPFREKRFFANTSQLLRAAVLASLFIISCAAVFKLSGGLPWRHPDKTGQPYVAHDAAWDYWASCENVADKLSRHEGLCRIGNPDGEITFMLWGDSHARALASGIDASAKRQGASGVISTELACPPFMGVDRAHMQSCVKFNNAVLEYLRTKPEIKTVVLAGRWALSANGSRYKQESGSPVRLRDTESASAKQLPNAEIFSAGLDRTIRALHKMGKQVVLVGPIPEVGINVMQSYFVAQATGRDISALIAPTVPEYQQRTETVMKIFAALNPDTSLRMIAVDKVLCDDKLCKVVVDDQPLYRDDDHLSTFGSHYVSHLFDDVFTR